MNPTTSLLFSIGDKVGGLQEALAVIKKYDLNMSRIESRPSKTANWDYDFFVDFENASQDVINNLIEELKRLGFGVTNPGNAGNAKPLISESQTSVQSIEWFPRKISDLDYFTHKVLAYGEDLDSDHPGFTDEQYRVRRLFITQIAKNYKHGDKIPPVEYTSAEIETWRSVYTNLSSMYPKFACKAQNYVLPLLEANFGYGPNNIPQLEDISKFLRDCTGWTLRPVTGLLSPRDFLNGLAFRVFHSTQYIRHHSRPQYTPEPDVCHELLGHVPLFADPDFADFSQEIGLASLGASDADIEKLATCYWFTVEFGLCKEDGQVKAYGAGLLSSFGELEYSVGSLEKKPKYAEFDPFKAAETKYPITEFQPLYFVAESFHSAKEKLKQFSATMDRPFSVRYNPYTQGVEILDNRHKLNAFIKEIQSNLSSLSSAISKLPGIKD